MEARTKKTSEIINSLFWGTFILLLGATLLGVNLGYINQGVWDNLWRLWPVLLIIWGLNIVFRHTYLQFMSYLSPLLLIGAFAYAVYTAPTVDEETSFHFPSIILGGRAPGPTSNYDFAFGKDPKVKSLDVKLELGASDVEMGPAAEGSFATVNVASNIGKPDVTFTLEGDKLKLYGMSPESRNIRNSRNDWMVKLPAGYPAAINIASGAADCNLDLRSITLTNLTVDSGAIDIDASLPAPLLTYKVTIDSGASDIKLKLPKGAMLQVQADSAIASSNFKDFGLVKDGDFWRSAGFDAAKPYIDIELDSAASDIKLEYEQP